MATKTKSRATKAKTANGTRSRPRARAKKGKPDKAPRKPVEDFEPDHPAPTPDDERLLKLIELAEGFGWFVAAAVGEDDCVIGLLAGTEEYIEAMMGPA